MEARLTDNLERYLPLMRMSWDELGFDYPMFPAFDAYRRMIADGSYLFAGCDSDGCPAGYLGVVVTPYLFNPSVLHAVVDSFFVHPDFRRSSAAGRLLREVMPHLVGRVHDLSFDCAPGSDLERVLVKRGFRLVEHSYSKVLGG